MKIICNVKYWIFCTIFILNELCIYRFCEKIKLCKDGYYQAKLKHKYAYIFKLICLNFQFNLYFTPIVILIQWNIIKHIILSQMIVINTDTSRGRHRSLRRFWKGGGIEPRKHYCACSVEFSRLESHSSDFCVVFIMKALRGMVSGAVSEISSAVTGSKHVAVRENVLAVTRDYISQPRLSEWPVLTMKGPYKQKPIPVAMCVCHCAIYTASANHPHHVIISCRHLSFNL